MGRIYIIAADVVVVVHFGWILFLIGGAWIGRRLRWVMWTHAGALGYSVLLQIFHWICPLTYLELWLWNRTPVGSYSGSFIAHYLEKLIYMDIPRGLVFALTVAVIVLSALVYRRAVFKTPTNP